MANPVTLLWLRRDLRLCDHPALCAAVARGAVVPVYIYDAQVDGLGAASKWRLGRGIECHAHALEAAGSRLILRRGPAALVLQELAAEVGATAVYWSRAYDPASQSRDSHVKSDLRNAGIAAKSFGGHLLFEPWTINTQQGGYYKVYSPFWRAVKDLPVETPLDKPDHIHAPSSWPQSDALGDWDMGASMQRGAAVMAQHARIGEAAAQARLHTFIAQKVSAYKERRDFAADDATSMLSEPLTYGEISPHQCWHAARQAAQSGAAGAEHFLKELVWREFAYHLMHHTPHILEKNWRAGWERFGWRSAEEAPEEVQRWTQGRTGVEFVDAAMRQMYVTGKMHNRARMIAASYLTKHLLVDWRVGQAWFEDCLSDWDIASNAMGWQWVAGSGPDAAPYFRVFNPDTQAAKFDRDGRYRDTWIAEGRAQALKTALSYFDAVPKSWGLSPDDRYPDPLLSLAEGRARALEIYENRDF
ncbi:deoxyribodipyrimidine photolyase [Litorivita pollutaquae]|uniref:Deoxyribodipyrimidine photolyase n=1 Tax=Litorivita pollutaquae TaxID=2200892 RepID=A0A2V4N057_9RHOB|nr:deoxyribodipyrimidine photo-lyase [Litorivita pollutaquae]PYC48224.1 deoxyribodipyrimidine photolyase [Litorivita pollutaquae]